MITPADIGASRQLLANLTLRELRSKYKRSAVGWGWSMLNPLATMLVFTIVFNLLLKVKPPPGDPSDMNIFAFFLLCGLLTWNFLAQGISGSMIALLGNANLIKKVYFPREILIAANVFSWVISLLIEFGVLAVALTIAGNFVLPWLPLVIVFVVVLTVFVLGVGLAISVSNVYFRDVQHFIPILLQMWFYATPIVYPVSLVPQRHDVLGISVPMRAIYDLNPMVRFVAVFRNLMYDLRFPAADDVAYVIAAALVSLALGLWVFSRFEPRLAEEL